MRAMPPVPPLVMVPEKVAVSAVFRVTVLVLATAALVSSPLPERPARVTELLFRSTVALSVSVPVPSALVLPRISLPAPASVPPW